MYNKELVANTADKIIEEVNEHIDNTIHWQLDSSEFGLTEFDDLYELELQKKKSVSSDIEDGKADVGWGSQIRSYVLDQSRIKDLRTGIEIGNTQSVLDGDLDKFIEASLKQGL